MGVLESIEDLGRRVIGQADDVRFKNEVKERAASLGTSFEAAQKIVFNEYLADVQSRARADKYLDYRSKDFKKFKAGLREVFGTGELEAFREYAEDPAVFTPLSPRPPFNRTEVEKYFSDRFDKNIPEAGILRGFSGSSSAIEDLLNRFSGDIRLRSTLPLEEIMDNHPDLAADLGRILIEEDFLKRFQGNFEKDLKFQESIKDFKKKGFHSLSQGLLAPWTFTSAVSRQILKDPSVEKILKTTMKEGATMTGKIIKHSVIFSAESVKFLASLIENKIDRN